MWRAKVVEMGNVKYIKCTKVEICICPVFILSSHMSDPLFSVNMTVFDEDRAIIGGAKHVFNTYDEAKEYYDSII
jgi:hypothetical protein